MSEWKPIDAYDGCRAVLVSARNRYGAYREPISAFRDATEVWRVLGSRGGMTQLGFSPAIFTEIPKPTPIAEGEK